MNKLIKVLLCGLIAMSLMSGCASKNNDNADVNGTNEPTAEPTPETTNESTDSVGTQLLATFNDFMAANPEATAMDAATAVAGNAVIPFEAVPMEVEPGFLNGFDNAEITGFEQGVMFAPMMGTIPFVGYIFTLPADADADAFVTTLTDSANLRWNICTEAEEMTTGTAGNTVFFLMAPLAFEDAE